MRVIELKVPPPILALLTGAAMWLILHHGPMIDLPPIVLTVSVSAIGACGAGLVFAGNIAFKRATTTINSVSPANASALVTSGIYRFTRNPMYLGILLGLVSWAVHLQSVLAFLGPILFVFYVQRFQIVPEEKALADKFGKAYKDYASQVRRWL